MAFRLPETREEVVALTATANRQHAQLAALRAALGELGQLARDPDARPRAGKRKRAAATRRTRFADLDRDAMERIADFVDCRFVFKLLCKAARDGTHGPTVTTAEHVGASVARLVWFRGAGLCPFSACTCVDAAVRSGNLEVLQFARAQQDNSYGWLPRDVLKIAAECNHLEIVTWGWNCMMNMAGVLDAAAAHGHLDVIRFLTSKGYTITCFHAEEAAKNGHVPVLDYCEEMGTFMNWQIAHAAMIEGQLQVFDWCLERSLLFNYRLAEHATRQGQVHVLDWAEERGLELTAGSGVDDAAERGHLRVLVWLHKRGLIEDMNRVIAAARFQPEIEEWARESGASAVSG